VVGHHLAELAREPVPIFEALPLLRRGFGRRRTEGGNGREGGPDQTSGQHILRPVWPKQRGGLPRAFYLSPGYVKVVSQTRDTTMNTLRVAWSSRSWQRSRGRVAVVIGERHRKNFITSSNS
jgi:hypothetical protein